MDQELLIKYIAGEATQAEKESVAEAIENSDKIRQEFIRLRRAYDAVVWMPADSIGVVAPRHTKHIWLYAAAIALLAICITGLYKINYPSAQMQIVYVPEGDRTHITLADGTTVWVGGDSRLTFPNRFTDGKREVSIEGEAYFEVTKDQQHPFIVNTPHQAAIRVLGTKFNIKARPNGDKIVAILTEGSICFESHHGKTLQETMLKPGNKLTYDVASGETQITAINSENELAWKDAKIVFDGYSLQEALDLLSDRYNVEFVLAPGLSTDDEFSGTFINQNLEQILHFIQATSNIGWRLLPPIKNKKRIEVYPL